MSYKDMKYILIFVCMRMKSFICLFLFFCVYSIASAQGWEVRWSSTAHMSGASEQVLPFWARTGNDGVLPSSSGATAMLGAELLYKSECGWLLEGGTSIAGYVTASESGGHPYARGLVDRLYLSAGWKMFRVDVGMMPRQRELGGLSVTGGNIMWTGNARNMPGVNLKSDWISVTERLAFRGNMAHYHMNDHRSVAGTRLHDKSLELKLDLGGGLELSGGLEHMAQWGGTSALYGPQPSSFDDFIRVFFARGGGDGASASDRINVLGNHLGREYLRLDWDVDRFRITFQYDKPFEDGSGTRFDNLPDGVWTLKLSADERESFVTDVVYEFINTTWQSGPLHERPATEEEMAGQDPSDPQYGIIILKGRDNYFNNSMYRSGWTYHGRVIGLPLINGIVFEDDGTVAGILCNRIRAHHLGIGGNLGRGVPYMFKATYSRNYGRYDQPESSPYSSSPWQLSMAMEAALPQAFTSLPVELTVGVYSDLGLLYPDSFGITLKLRYSGLRTL